MKTVLAVIGLIATAIALYITGVVAFVDIFLDREIFTSPIITTILSLVGGAVANLSVFVVLGLRAKAAFNKRRQERESTPIGGGLRVGRRGFLD